MLLADAMHTQSDVWTSVTVIIALAGAALGYPILDPIAALIVVVFIGHAAWEIFRSTSEVLSDHIVIPEDEVRAVVMSVPDVMGCHEIRTRGSRDFVFLDLHIWMAADTRLDAAHEISHDVKDRLMTKFPQIGDAIIHLEPPPRDDDPRLTGHRFTASQALGHGFSATEAQRIRGFGFRGAQVQSVELDLCL